MRNTIRNRKSRRRGILSVTTLVFVLLLLVVPSAQAGYEQGPEHFGGAYVGENGDEFPLANGVDDVAINETGAGGVEPGPLYIVGDRGRVYRFGPGKEGEEPPFREGWGWNAGSAFAEAYQRCGPAYAAEPRPANAFPSCRESESVVVEPGEEPGHLGDLCGGSVVQSTGNV